jgi:hypothetical protein
VISRNGSAVDGRGAAGDRDAVVVTQLHALAPHLDGEPDPGFRAATRARLVAMAAVRSPEPEPVPPLRRLMTIRSADAVPPAWRTRLTAGLAGAALTVTALSTLVALSTDARPGDVLYGLKRGTEQTQLALAGDSRRGQTLLDLASTRLEELEHLVSEDAAALPGAAPADGVPALLAAGAEPELVLQTLDTMDAQTADGAAWLGERAVTAGDAGPLVELAGWAAAQSAGLDSLEPDVPEAARSAFDRSQVLLAQVGTRAAGLRTALDCPAGPATEGADELGPRPGTCVAAPPADGDDPAPPPGTGGATSASGTTGGVPGRASGTTGPSAPQSDTPGGGNTGDLPGGLPGGVPGGVPSTGSPGGGRPSLPLPSVEVTPPAGLPTVTLPGGEATTPSLDVGICLDPLGLGGC